MKMKRPFSLRRVVKEWNRENILRFLGYILAAFVINLALECLSRRSFGDGLHYMVTRPWQFFYDSLIILFTLSLSLLFRKRSFCFLLFAAVWIGLGLANCILLGFRATPLTAPDIWLLSSVRDIIEIYMSQPVLILLMLGIAALIGVIVLLWLRAKKTRPSYYFAAVQVLLCGVILAGFTVAFLRSGTLASRLQRLCLLLLRQCGDAGHQRAGRLFAGSDRRAPQRAGRPACRPGAHAELHFCAARVIL